MYSKNIDDSSVVIGGLSIANDIVGVQDEKEEEEEQVRDRTETINAEIEQVI